MAFEPSYLTGTPAAPREDKGSLIGDLGKAAAAGATELHAQGAGLIADVAGSQPGEPLREIQGLFNEVTKTIDENISPENKRAGESALIPTEEGQQSFFAAPGRSTAMKVARMSPMLLGAFFLPQGWAGVAAGSAFFGTQGVAQQLNDTRRRIDEMPDATLQEKSEVYRDLRAEMDEPQAREQFIKSQNDLVSLLMAGGSQAVGGGALAHALRGQAAKGVLAGTGVGAAEGVMGGVAMGAGMEGARQRADVKGGLRHGYDAETIALAALNAGFEVGALGAGFGAVGSMGSRRDRASGKVVDGEAPNPAQDVALNEQFEGTNTTRGETPPAQPDAIPPGAEAPPAAPSEAQGGPLARQIAEERARQAAPPEGQAPPPVVPPVAPDVVPPPSPLPTPDVLPAEVMQRTPNPRTESVVPPPPTDTMLAPGRRRGEMERTAVPLAEEVAPTPANMIPSDRLTAAEVREVTDTIPAPEAPRPVEQAAELVPDVPEITALNEAIAKVAAPPARKRIKEVVIERKADAPKAMVAEAMPIAELVRAEPGKPRVFAVRNELTERAAAERMSREERVAEAKDRNYLAEAKRAQRARNKVQPNETKAQEYVKATQPKDVEELTRVGTIESNALAGNTDAQRQVVERANRLIADAEKAGIEIPQRTPWSKAASEKGVKNPVPYTSHLIETRRFIKRVKDAQALKDQTRREKATREAFTDYVTTERAMRAGDLQGAAERRLAANAEGEARNAKSRSRTKAEADELRALMEEQAADADGRYDESMEDFDSVLRREESGGDRYEDLDESYSRSQRSAAVRDGQPDKPRNTTAAVELARLRRDFDTYTDEKTRPKVDLMTEIVDRLTEVAGDTPIEVKPNAWFEQHHPDKGVQGKFVSVVGGADAAGRRGKIYLNADWMNTAEGPRVVIHEIVHAATHHALRADPQAVADLNALHRAVMKHWTKFTKEERAQLSNEYGYVEGAVNSGEFLAEAMANPRFQKFLMQVPAPPEIIARYHLNRPMSFWGALVHRIARVLGLKGEQVNVLEGVLNINDRLMAYEPGRQNTVSWEQPQFSRAVDRAREEVVDFAREAPKTARTTMRRLGLKLATFTQIGQMAERLFGEGTPATKLSNLMARAAVEKDRILDSGDRKLVSDMAERQRKTSPEQWNEFAGFLHDETMAGVFADGPPPKGATPKGTPMASWQGAAQHAELKRRFDALPKELQQLRTRLHTYFRERQNALSLERLKNIVRVINDGVPDNALATKIFEGKLDDAEKAVLKKDAVFKAIKDARALSKITGPYVPLMRRGDHVVTGRYLITSPGNARRLNGEGAPDPQGSVFEFKTRDEAKAFAEAQQVKVLDTRRVFTDPATGERTVEITLEDGSKEIYKLTKEDAAWGVADERYRVNLQDKHLEFFEREVDARQRQAELMARPDMQMEGVAPRRWEPGGSNASFMSETFNRALHSLQQRKGFQELDDGAKRALIEHLRDASLSALGSTRPQSRRLPRTYVAGASNDIMTNTGQYASSSAGYLARLKYQPQVDAALKEMTDYAHDYRYEATERTYPRGQILRELKERVYRQGDPEPYGFWQSAGNRLLQMSFLDKLASPAFHIINSAEPWTISMPVLAGRFKVGRTMAALNQAYRDIGAGSAVGAGLSDTAKALRSDQGLTNYLHRFQERLRKQPDGKHLGEMLGHLYETGLLSRDAGMELHRMSTPSAPRLGRALDRADLMARQMGTAIESINRTVTAVAAYRLEFAKTKSHEQAMAFAHKTVHDTMGDYSGWNAAPIFNHPVGRLALQFKKYAQKTYYLLGKTAATAFRGDKEAMRAFAGIMATHVAVAGTLGLPLEAIKAGFIAANLLGVTSSTYGDFERWTRELAAKNLGVGGGQIVTRGVPRYLGVDLSSRMGLESLIFPMGEPKSTKPDDLLTYAAKAFAGAPIGLIAEYPAGLKALWDGDVALGMEKLVPLKMWADSVQAYQKFEQGKRTPSGRQTLEPYSVGEAATKMLGFTPGREAEQGEMRGALMKQQQRDRDDRARLTGKWVNASPAEKSAMWRQIQQWNASQPAEARIKLADLTAAMQRRTREARNSNNEFGLRTSTRDKYIREGVEYYNVR